MGLISRNEDNLEKLTILLKAENIKGFYKSADIKNEKDFQQVVIELTMLLGGIDTLFYNAANLKVMDILQESRESLIEDFTTNVIGAQQAFKLLYPKLQQRKGSMLISGGGLAFNPQPNLGSLALGKAGIRNLALQLSEIGSKKDIYVGILNITDRILPESLTHSPELLAEKFWILNTNRTAIEETY